jgi:two-component sensor histidine kinase
VLVRAIPLLEHRTPTGAIVLVRDVTDLRRRDRLLVSKDATIREVHHRVKNNLQTISSLLRLQARRLGSGGGRTALEEAERRIRSIAVVHEILSRDPGDQVAFGEILRSLVHMAEEAAASFDRPVRIEVRGDPGEVPADAATPLAVVVAELLQNAVEHAFSGPGPWDDPAARRIGIELSNDGVELQVRVWDNGRGLPQGFDVSETTSLGLSLVRDLVTGQLKGQIMMGGEGGTRVALAFPLPEPTDLG